MLINKIFFLIGDFLFVALNEVENWYSLCYYLTEQDPERKNAATVTLSATKPKKNNGNESHDVTCLQRFRTIELEKAENEYIKWSLTHLLVLI